MAMAGRIARLWGIAGAILFLAFILAFVALTTFHFVINAPNAALVQRELEQEFQSIKPLPDAIPLRFHASHKTHQSLVVSTYSTRLSYPEIRKYYDSELSAHGWKFQVEHNLKDWGRDFGGRTAEYTKGSYTASLPYAGEKANYGWVYGLDLSWGLHEHAAGPGIISSKLLSYLIYFLFSSFVVSVLTLSYIQTRVAKKFGWPALRDRPFLDTYWRELSKTQRCLLWPGIVAFMITLLVVALSKL
jgi:hypothetical protein